MAQDSDGIIGFRDRWLRRVGNQEARDAAAPDEKILNASEARTAAEAIIAEFQDSKVLLADFKKHPGDPELAIFKRATLEEQMEASLKTQRSMMSVSDERTLLGILGRNAKPGPNRQVATLVLAAAEEFVKRFSGKD